MKLNGHITSYTKLMHDLSGEAKVKETKGLTKERKGLTKDLIVEYGILNVAKYFPEEYDHKIIKYFNLFLNISKRLHITLWHRNQKVCQMKVLNLLLYQIIALKQDYSDSLKF